MSCKFKLAPFLKIASVTDNDIDVSLVKQYMIDFLDKASKQQLLYLYIQQFDFVGGH